MALERFNPPGSLDELDAAGRAAWSERVDGILDDFRGFAQFFNPLRPGGAEPVEHRVAWPAFPATLLDPGTSDPERWAQADGSRDEQDEYCEWGVERSGDEIARVTFTTETPDYFNLLLQTEPTQLLELYREMTGDAPDSVDALKDDRGGFDPKNEFNRTADGRIAHLSQVSNNLFAAVALVAQATVLREKNGARVTEKKALVRCGGLGDDQRSSDPAIAIAINNLAAAGDEISVADPPGLYIDDFIAAGIETPDDVDAGQFWEITRGDDAHALRATFEVPPERGYSISQIKVDGKPIEFGAQLADRVRIRVAALSREANHRPPLLPCGAQVQ